MISRPHSAVSQKVGFCGAVGAVLSFAGAYAAGGDTLVQWLSLMLGAALPMWWLEFRGVAASVATLDRKQVLLGVATIAALQSVILTLQMELGGRTGGAVAQVLPVLLCGGSVLLMLAILRPELLGETVPATGRAAFSLLRGRSMANDERLAVLGWGVKCFFLPLMLAWSWNWIAGLEYQSPSIGLIYFYSIGISLLYAVDTAFGLIGYLSTAKCLGGEIRSVDGTISGWLSALVCYPPLSALVVDTWLIARNANHWQDWLESSGVVSGLWAGCILLLTGIYTWSTVAFGPRFSNLTHRGIITHGPYRWSKHPAYISKNLSWWLISVPFLSTSGVWPAFLSCLAMLAINAVYWVRARTEERHLRHDPVYCQYSSWVRKHGLIAKIWPNAD